MVNRIKGDTPVGQIARQIPAAIDVFEALDIEFACKGGRALTEACEAAGVEADTVADAIAGAAKNGAPKEPGVGELIHLLLFEQHAHERAVMTQLGDLLRRNQNATPEIARIRRIFANLEWLIREHMQREERDLFPVIETLGDEPRNGSLASRFCIEYVEHDVIDATLHKLRELRLRADLHGAPRELIDTLEGFERRVYRHMHLENNVLFPKVLEMENEARHGAAVPYA